MNGAEIREIRKKAEAAVLESPPGEVLVSAKTVLELFEIMAAKMEDADKVNETIAGLKDEIYDLEAKIADLEDEKLDLKDEIADLEGQIRGCGAGDFGEGE